MCSIQYQLVETTYVLNEVDGFRNVADDAQLKLWDEIEALKKAISETGESNAADIEELRRAFNHFKLGINKTRRNTLSRHNGVEMPRSAATRREM